MECFMIKKKHGLVILSISNYQQAKKTKKANYGFLLRSLCGTFILVPNGQRAQTPSPNSPLPISPRKWQTITRVFKLKTVTVEVGSWLSNSRF